MSSAMTGESQARGGLLILKVRRRGAGGSDLGGIIKKYFFKKGKSCKHTERRLTSLLLQACD